MKKMLLLLMISGFACTAVFAQDDKDHKDKKADKAEWEKKFKEELKLTADQTVKYDALTKEYQGKFDELMKDASLTDDARKEKKMGLKKEKEGKLMEILTPDQQAKYKEMMEKKKSPKPAGA